MLCRRRSSATKPMPARIASDGARGEKRLPFKQHLAARALAQAEDRFQRFRPPGADEPAETEDLAAMQIEGDVAHQRRQR